MHNINKVQNILSHLSLITLGNTLRFISTCYILNHIHSAIFLRNADRHIPPLPHSKLKFVFFDEGQMFVSILSQLDPINTPQLSYIDFNPLNAALNPIRHLLSLAGAHHFVHVSRLRVNTIPQILLKLLSLDIF